MNVNLNHLRYMCVPADGDFLRYYHDAQPLVSAGWPYTDENGRLHDALTDATEPAATVFNVNTQGTLLLGKPITNIREADGLVSFRFMQPDTPDAVSSPALSADRSATAVYDLSGRRLSQPSSAHRQLTIQRRADGRTTKTFR